MSTSGTIQRARWHQAHHNITRRHRAANDSRQRLDIRHEFHQRSVGVAEINAGAAALGAEALERPAFDNVGEGFWTHQFQGGVAVYPFDTKATGISAAFAYALHGERSGLHVTPGSDVTLDWAITQYLPLASDRSMLLDLGPTGDSQWQVTDDTGSGATPGSSHGQLHSVGGEVGFTYVPWSADLKVRYTDDVAAENRFKGQTVAVSIGAKL